MLNIARCKGLRSQIELARDRDKHGHVPRQFTVNNVSVHLAESASSSKCKVAEITVTKPMANQFGTMCMAEEYLSTSMHDLPRSLEGPRNDDNTWSRGRMAQR